MVRISKGDDAEKQLLLVKEKLSDEMEKVERKLKKQKAKEHAIDDIEEQKVIPAKEKVEKAKMEVKKVDLELAVVGKKAPRKWQKKEKKEVFVPKGGVVGKKSRDHVEKMEG